MNYDEIESEYLIFERQGMTDEGYWAAVNGTEFDKGVWNGDFRGFRG